MKRRDFIISTSMASLGSMALGLNARPLDKTIVTAGDMQDYLRSLHEVSEPSVDRIVIGDPRTKILKAGTCWQPYFSTLRKAWEQGINLMIVHEPAFYTHWDLDRQDDLFNTLPSPARERYTAAIEEKRSWIQENKMVIIRCHDVMDIVKGFGIPFALGHALGYSHEDIVRSKDYYNVYRVETASAWKVARNIASKLLVLNQPGVAFYGDRERMISTVGLGTGCICDPNQYMELNPDLVIAIDDTVRTWTQTSFAEDTGDPLVVINHGTAEETGMRMLNQHLSQSIPDLEFVHLNQGCTYRWIPGV